LVGGKTTRELPPKGGEVGNEAFGVCLETHEAGAGKYLFGEKKENASSGQVKEEKGR